MWQLLTYYLYNASFCGCLASNLATFYVLLLSAAIVLSHPYLRSVFVVVFVYKLLLLPTNVGHKCVSHAHTHTQMHIAAVVCLQSVPHASVAGRHGV